MRFSDFINESILDVSKKTLDPLVFSEKDENGLPVLNENIKKQILFDIDDFKKIIPIKDFFITGSILTKKYKENTDIDVTVEVFDSDLTDTVDYRVSVLIKSKNGKLANNTQHPINYFVLSDKKRNDENYQGIYDITSDKWVKIPKNYNVNVDFYLKEFQANVSRIDLLTAELRRDIIDYSYLTKLEDDEVDGLKTLLQSKLYEISKDIEQLVDIKKTIKKKRDDAYSRPLNPSEIALFKTKQALPEDVIYKLLERYYYWEFINKLEELLKKNKIVKPKDLETIKKAEDELSESKSVFLTELRRVKLPKIDWTDNKKVGSHLHKVYRGMNRKNLMQVPDSQNSISRYASWRNLGTAQKVVNTAKKSPSGMWRVSPFQVREIANKYHHFPPNEEHKIKHLGNTGIMVWYKSPGVYYLIKPSKHARLRR